MMTKDEAVKLFVDRNFTAIDTEWVKIVAEAKGADVYSWPMWGTMWEIDSFLADRLAKHTIRKVGEADEIDPEDIEDDTERAAVVEAIRALKAEEISWGECALLEKYIDEEMPSALCIGGTAAYLYEIDGKHLIGVNGAGWNFYDGVWNTLYDLAEMKWHDEETTKAKA